jgi:hypothetical protein
MGINPALGVKCRVAWSPKGRRADVIGSFEGVRRERKQKVWRAARRETVRPATLEWIGLKRDARHKGRRHEWRTVERVGTMNAFSSLAPAIEAAGEGAREDWIW